VPMMLYHRHSCRRRGCRGASIGRIRAKMHAKSFKTRAKPLKTSTNSLKIRAKIAPKMTWRVFFLFFYSRVFFGQVWKNSGKNPSYTQKFASSYTYNHRTISMTIRR